MTTPNWHPYVTVRERATMIRDVFSVTSCDRDTITLYVRQECGLDAPHIVNLALDLHHVEQLIAMLQEELAKAKGREP